LVADRIERIVRATGIAEHKAVEGDPAISQDGKSVAFVSNRYGTPQIFLQKGNSYPKRITYEGRYNSSPSWSPKGNMIAYASLKNNKFDIYVYDINTGLTERITDGSLGVPSDGDSKAPSMSSGGRFVGFESTATNLALPVTNDNGDISDIFLHDRAGDGLTTIISLDNDGEGTDGDSESPSISSDGTIFNKIYCIIINACNRSGVKRLVHLSALGTSPEAKSEYHRTKLLAEEAISESSLDYTIFRPSVIFGEDDAFVNLFAPLIRKLPVMGVIGSGNYRMQPVYIEDLVSCMVRSLDDKITFGRIYEIG